MSNRQFSVTDYQAARADMLATLRQIAQHRHTVSYSEFGRMLTEPIHHRNPLLYELLRDICYDERQQGRPDLCALVVRKSDGMPGKGYFEGSALSGHDVSNPREYWEHKLNECWDYYATEQDNSL